MHKDGSKCCSLYSYGCSFRSDFLLAATIVCLDVYHGLQPQVAGSPSDDVFVWGTERQGEMIAALQRSYEIWNGLRDESMDAWKASSVLGVMLEKMNSARNRAESEASVFQPQDEKQNAAMTLGLLSSGMTPTNNASTGFTEPPIRVAETPLPRDISAASSPFNNMFSQMPDIQLNLDWVCSDPFLYYGRGALLT